ncbi:MAG: hypothetical protein ACR2JK_10025 [Geodermatophilaceae bacterium]
MRFEVNMRARSGYEVEASYVEVTDGPVSSSFALVGFVPGYPTAILAAIPVEMVESVLPALPGSGALPR